MNNHSIAFQFWLDLKRKHKIFGTLNHEAIIADIEELLNRQAAKQSVQADKCPVCNGQRGFQVGVYWESCDTCNGTGTCR